MTKTYLRYPCPYCGQSISGNGFAKTSHYRKHVREGLLIEKPEWLRMRRYLRFELANKRTFYFGHGGSDDKDGRSWRTRFATLAKAESVARPGDFVYTHPYEPRCICEWGIKEGHLNQAGGYCCPHFGNTCGAHPHYEEKEAKNNK